MTSNFTNWTDSARLAFDSGSVMQFEPTCCPLCSFTYIRVLNASKMAMTAETVPPRVPSQLRPISAALGSCACTPVDNGTTAEAIWTGRPWHWLTYTMLACLSKSHWHQSRSFGSLTYRKYFGSRPSPWIIQSQLQRKPYERQQENRDFCRVLRRLIWLRTKDAYWRCSVVTFLESLSNIPIQLFWSPSYNVLNLTMDFERNLLTAEHYFQLYQINAGWPLLLLGGQAG